MKTICSQSTILVKECGENITKHIDRGILLLSIVKMAPLPPKSSPSKTIAKLTAENHIVLPQSIADEIEPNKYFDVKVEDGKIILTPVTIL
jgi:hypothetical protein